MAYNFNITTGVLPSGRTVYYGTRINSDEERFVIGYRTQYQGNVGLFNTNSKPGLIYTPDDFRKAHGFWADFIYPTAYAESKGSFFCLNTYDRARFTFGFMQYAAHVPNGDFVRYLKELLQLPLAADYFPRLVLKEDRIHYQNSNQTLTQLESNTSTQGLVNYLNPTLLDVENQEALSAARMVHWTQDDPQNRLLQVRLATQLFEDHMPRYHRQLGLDQAPAKVCLVVCDILHQGRGKFSRIAAALNTNGNWEQAYANLLTIGEVSYGERIKTLKRKTNEAVNAGTLDKIYDAGTNRFV
jgi:hypothetical protein